MDIGKSKYSFHWKENVFWPISESGDNFHFNILDDVHPASNLPTVLKENHCYNSVNDYVFASNLFCKHLIVGNMAPVEDKVECGIDYFLKENDDDIKLEQLVSKFDPSIEAIWNISNSHSAMYDVISSQEDFHWTFQASITSDKDLLKMELNHPNNFASSMEKNKFIHNGMNITNSIWSKQPYSNHYGNIDHTQQKPMKDITDLHDCLVNDGVEDLLCRLKLLEIAAGNLFQEKLDYPDNFASTMEKNKFIHSGTNITNSIWSKQPYSNHYGCFDHFPQKSMNDTMDSHDVFVNEEVQDLLCRLKLLEIATSNMFQERFKILDLHPMLPKENSDLDLVNDLVDNLSENNLDVILSKITSDPDTQHEEKCCLFGINSADEIVCMLQNSPTNMVPSDSNNKVTEADPIILAENNRSLNILNHNPAYSSFTVVKPRQHTKEASGDDDAIQNSLANCSQIKYSETTLHVNCNSECDNGEKKEDNDLGHDSHCDSESNETAGNETAAEEKKTVGEGGETEEEDLLTSMRTHFRPIQQDHHSNPNYCYADGTTFIISNSFADVSFKRSASGSLFLDSDDSETVKKYMEYRDTKLDKERCTNTFCENVLTDKNIFIPKFCVDQIEKSCQTEGDCESDLDCSKINGKSCSEVKSNLLLLEDTSLIREMVNSLDNNNSDQFNSGNTCENNGDIIMWMRDVKTVNDKRNDTVCQVSQTKSNFWNDGCGFSSYLTDKHALEPHDCKRETESVWKTNFSTNCLCQSRINIWCYTPESTTEFCSACNNANYKTSQYCKLQLREELSKDGEQLLSDLRDLQHLQLDVGCMEDVLESSDWPSESNSMALVNRFENCTSLCKKCM